MLVNTATRCIDTKHKASNFIKTHVNVGDESASKDFNFSKILYINTKDMNCSGLYSTLRWMAIHALCKKKKRETETERDSYMTEILTFQMSYMHRYGETRNFYSMNTQNPHS